MTELIYTYDSSKPVTTFLVLGSCRELTTAMGATSTDNLRSCCCTPLWGGLFVLFLRQYIPQSSCVTSAGIYSTKSDERTMVSGTSMPPMPGHSDTELAYL